MPDVQCGLIGCGTVGGGVVARWAEEVAGAALAAVAVRSPRKRRDVDLSAVTVTADAWAVVRDPRIGVLIDASGDCEAARSWALEGFERGKSFVTAGKALVARHGAELERSAAAHGAGFRYEAAVAGALPVVALLRLGLSPGTVRGFEGMERHCANARAVAAFLDDHTRVERVYFPGLEAHPGHDIAARQMRDFGGVISFELKGGGEEARAFASRVRLWTLAESLGSVKSLLCHPATMTHASVEPEVRRRNGISDGLIRLSAGIEDVRDLVSDLDEALAGASVRQRESAVTEQTSR